MTPTPSAISKEDGCLRIGQLVALHNANPWPSAEKGETPGAALLNPHSQVTAWVGKRLVDLGNAISDGFLVAYYRHLLALPEFQGQNVGGGIMRRQKAKHESFHQQTFAADGKGLDFFGKCGFECAVKTEPMWIYGGHDH